MRAATAQTINAGCWLPSCQQTHDSWQFGDIISYYNSYVLKTATKSYTQKINVYWWRDENK